MKNNKSKLQKLYQKRQDLILEGKDISRINSAIREEEYNYCEWLKEDVSATGGPAGAAGAASVGISGGGVAYGSAATPGMGAVSSPQPSSYAGVTTDPGYSSGGGKVGSGDIAVPYNSAPKKVFQKIGVDDRRGSNKRRNKKVLAGLKQALKSRKQDFTANQGGVPNFTASKKSTKILSWDSFTKDNLNKVTHVKEDKK
jgi:hypothetical protein